MKRYLSFLDIHGFKNLVFDTPLDQITRRLGYAIQNARYAECLGGIKEIEGVAHPDESLRSVHRFSFSDSFVLASKDALGDSLNSIIVSTCLMAQRLFAMQLPVRGAIVAGEADFVPDTNHLVGRGVIEAIELEAQQDWFGIMLDPALGSYEQVAGMLHPGVLPMVVRYPIPLKTGIPAGSIAVNCSAIRKKRKWMCACGSLQCSILRHRITGAASAGVVLEEDSSFDAAGNCCHGAAMTITLEELTKGALQLPGRQRLALAEFLLAMTEGSATAEADQAWEEEIQLRINAVDSGRATGIPWQDVLHEAEQRLVR